MRARSHKRARGALCPLGHWLVAGVDPLSQSVVIPPISGTGHHYTVLLAPHLLLLTRVSEACEDAVRLRSESVCECVCVVSS